MSKITREERLNLDRLIQKSDQYQDNTEHIRSVKHSHKIQNDIQTILDLKRKHEQMWKDSREEFRELCRTEAAFLNFHYMDIFNKVVNDEMNLEIMYKFLWVLRQVEDGNASQEVGSVAIGKLLKEIYLDSALRRSDNLDKQHAEDGTEIPAEPIIEPRPISWKMWQKKRAEIVAQLDDTQSSTENRP